MYVWSNRNRGRGAWPGKENGVKYIVEAQKQEKQDKGPAPHKLTLCGKCTEDPRFCIEF